MCNDCPELQKKLQGLSKLEIAAKSSPIEGLCCGECGTTLEAIKTGHPLGCPVCYEVFEEVIFQDLVKEHRIPRQFIQLKPKETLYLGDMPQKGEHLSPSSRLIALNEALQATLEKEDYEQAALIRDQIKQLTEKQRGE
jgi:protein arginine kinase activator